MIRRERRRFAGSLKIIFLSLTVILILIAFLIARSGIFNIKQIEIQGDKIDCTDSDQLKNASGLYGKNFFLLKDRELAENLKGKFVCIENVRSLRLIPDKVKLEMTSRKPAAILLNLKDKQASSSSLIENIATPEASAAQDRYFVDSEGVVFSKSMYELNFSKIYIYDPEIAVGKKLENNFINNSLKILAKIKTFGVNAKKSWISEDFFIINPDTSDPKIIFRLNDRIDIQLASLQLILTEAKIDLKELTFIDLRFDKPIVRFAPKNHG